MVHRAGLHELWGPMATALGVGGSGTAGRGWTGSPLLVGPTCHVAEWGLGC